MSFKIEGFVELICDRSLDAFDYQVRLEDNLILKFGEESEATKEDEIAFIPWNTQTIYLGQYIYEFLSLAVPMKKLHPRYMDEDDDDDDGQEDMKLIYSSKEASGNNREDIDPRWQKLKEIKGDKKNTSK